MSRRFRTVAIAGLLGLLFPGLGHLWIGRASRFVFPALAWLIFHVTVGLAGSMATFAGAISSLAALVALRVYAILDPPVLVWRHPVPSARWYTRWYVYVGWIATVICVVATLAHQREAWFGYDIFRVPGTTMSPTIEPGEIVLVDMSAHRIEPPALGAVVVVREPESGQLFVRRVARRSSSQISFAIDNPGGAGLDAESSSAFEYAILGRVTYVLLSSTWGRIGRRIL